jgi:probable addiction module antidote protein
MAETILPFDAADYLTSDQAVADYLAAAFETGDAADVSHALATIARARGVGKLASKSGKARGTLYKAIGEGANPTLETLLPLLRAMGMTLTVRRLHA